MQGTILYKSGAGGKSSCLARAVHRDRPLLSGGWLGSGFRMGMGESVSGTIERPRKDNNVDPDSILTQSSHTAIYVLHGVMLEHVNVCIPGVNE